MEELKDMKVDIIDIKERTAMVFRKVFSHTKATVVCADLLDYYPENKDSIDCLVSPGNSFGHMTGGYDEALSHLLGEDFQLDVREKIYSDYYGEQNVGTSFIMDTPIKGLRLIHTPTMQYPEPIKDDFVIYSCMRSTLICALQNHVSHIVLPIFGGEAGHVKPEISSKRMLDAYTQIRDHRGPKYEIW